MNWYRMNRETSGPANGTSLSGLLGKKTLTNRDSVVAQVSQPVVSRIELSRCAAPGDWPSYRGAEPEFLEPQMSAD